tara:strand:+ start:266 stop:481 length:216 start_codon:yes stop_codon:yes gene_type:complete
MTGYLLDIAGRRMIFTVTFMVAGAMLIVTPLSAPNQGLYIACGVIFFLFASVQEDNPLIMDYVIKEDRGKA